MTALAQSAHDVWTLAWHVVSVVGVIGLFGFLAFVAAPDLLKPEPPALSPDVDLDEMRATVVGMHPAAAWAENQRWTRGL